MSQLDVQELPGSERILLASGKGFFPRLVRTADGALLAVYRDGGGHGGHGGFLVASRSEDAGRTWSEEVTVVNTHEYDDRNPAVGVAKDGTITVAYHANGMYGGDGGSLHGGERRNPKKLHTGLVHSTGDGRTWGEPMLWTDAAEWDGMSPYGHILTLDDGRMAMPIYWDKSFLLWSHDGGYAWGDLTRVADDINEAAYCVLPSGEWLCLGRKVREREETKMLLRRSSDGGRTWSEPTPFYPSWRYPADLVVLSDGSVLAAYGFREPPHGARARRSTDGGRTWSKRELVLDNLSPFGDCGYPSTALVDGWVVTIFYSAGRFKDFSDASQCTCQGVRYREEELIAALR